jgi:ABC-2 type transport system ATP-binding protein
MVKVSHLTKRYGNVTAISDLNFEIKKGEIVGFLGPNGAGKTTTMRILTGFIPPSSGKVEIDGHDVLDDSIEARKLIGYLPENAPLYLDMEVDSLLTYFAELKHVKKEERKEQIDKILIECGLEDVRKEIIKRLSKGYRQRVALAQALIGDPEFLILDEPTITLDPKQVSEIRKLIKDLGKKRTVILSTHILSEVSAICDRVMIISKGKIVAQDTPDNLTSSLSDVERVTVKIKGPQDEVLSGLNDINDVKIARIAQKYEDDINSFSVESVKGVDLRKIIAREVISRGWDLLELKKEDVKLEDVFLKLTK